MERGSDEHGPLVDDELKRETRSMEQGAPVSSRVEPHREVEPIDDDVEEDREDEDAEEEQEQTEEGRS